MCQTYSVKLCFSCILLRILDAKYSIVVGKCQHGVGHIALLLFLSLKTERDILKFDTYPYEFLSDSKIVQLTIMIKEQFSYT